MTFNPDIHHRRSIRLREYDYATVGAYFVTICVQERESLFGHVTDGEMRLNEAGLMVAHAWSALPARFPNVTLDEYMIMPNHFHGIVMIDNDDGAFDRRGEPCVRPPLNVDCNHQNLVDQNLVDQNQVDQNQVDQNQGDHKDRPYGTIENSLGRFIQAFKSLTTNAYIRGVKQSDWPSFPGRFWQRNYYERVIRDDCELAATREYIHYNPLNWPNDDEYQP